MEMIGDGDELFVPPAPIIPTKEEEEEKKEQVEKQQGDKDNKQQEATAAAGPPGRDATAWEKAAVGWKATAAAWRRDRYIPTLEETKALLELADDMEVAADACCYCGHASLLLAFLLGCLLLLSFLLL